MEGKSVKIVFDGQELPVVNMTPHDVHVYVGGERVLSIPKSGMQVRVTPQEENAGFFKAGGVHIPIARVKHGPLNYPYTPKRREVWVVSSIIIHYLRENGVPEELRDVVFVSPDTSPRRAVRDDEGRIIGVQGFNTL